MAHVIDKRADLWKQYSESKSSSIREKLIMEYASLVKYVAGRLSIYFGKNVEYEDLLSYGTFGLLDAIEKFDIAKGVKFETYASLRIRGAIIDSIRQLDWAPRTLRQKSKNIEKAYSELDEKLGRQPKDSEVADKLGITIEEYHKVLNDVHISHLVSLDEYLEITNNESGLSISNKSQFVSPTQHVEFNEMKQILANTIELLPEKEKTVVTLYYFDELTLKEISAIMKVSESRISQLHSKAVGRLRSKLGKSKSIFYE